MKNKIQCVYGKLYRGSRPENIDDLHQLWSMGVRTIICLQEGWSWAFGAYDSENDWENLGGKYIKRPLSNFFFPVKDELDSLNNIIGSRTGMVFVHCKAGVDRTGVVSGYYLLKCGLANAKTAWEYIGETGMHPWYRLLWKRKFFEVFK